MKQEQCDVDIDKIFKNGIRIHVRTTESGAAIESKRKEKFYKKFHFQLNQSIIQS